ncbi:LytTR family DNA-binding domain-containing protein [Streptococcus oricebi]|uniref:Transcriptional regulator n=1 Tax=Streptococcus oricebi TaxID=1547447 RepID=A0ABS5B3V3_9STRE|nr:LytTR family DNA-binding domain-containing protein [Streptococcus oricebi]MBP2622654.1 transcriptional regulator [Streptococcus oricebi]
MQTKFEVDPQYSSADPLVLVKAEQLTDEAQEVFAYLQGFQRSQAKLIPIKTDDKILMIRLDNIILADITKTNLLVYTSEGTYQTTESLTHFSRRLNSPNFIQISKHALINIDHLESLSDSFSGNMKAKLSKQIKADVSRKYLKGLMDYLGI